jgi:hypothetical protein
MNTWDLKAANTTQLAVLYGITRKQMARMIKHHQHHIGIRVGYFWRVDQIIRIFEHVGPPTHFRIVV